MIEALCVSGKHDTKLEMIMKYELNNEMYILFCIKLKFHKKIVFFTLK